MSPILTRELLLRNYTLAYSVYSIDYVSFSCTVSFSTMINYGYY